jgi:hypothetical protein
MPGNWPQVYADSKGAVIVVYAGQLNEGRGIYLVRSTDNGATWMQPQLVFDAVKAGWEMVDYPSLAVAQDGSIHIAWVKAARPNTWPAQGIYYSFSKNNGKTWSDPQILAEKNYDFPRLALTYGKVHLLFSDPSLGRIWHRSIDIKNEESNAWSTAVSIGGTENIAPFYGLVNDGTDDTPGGRLHLVGLDRSGGQMVYATWDTRWSQLEVIPLQVHGSAGIGVNAATMLQGKTISAVLQMNILGQDNQTQEAIIFSSRNISTIEFSSTPTLEPTAVIVTPKVSQPTRTPSPTPDLSGEVVISDVGSTPLILGGGLAAALLIFVLIMRSFWMRKRR